MGHLEIRLDIVYCLYYYAQFVNWHDVEIELLKSDQTLTSKKKDLNA